jgi:orotidine 5'-phosphate decarboxylase subfamily 1/orotate phosphoribosyltransferase
MNHQSLILDLERSGAVKFGNFVLKSGKVSPFYIDLRDIVSKPDIFQRMVDMLIDKVREMEFDVVTGIPYTALPYAAVIAQRLGKPLVYCRKEEKTYGLGGSIVGSYKQGDRCLVIDDVITTGESKIETAESFEAAGLKVQDFVVFIDRSLRAREVLAGRGYRLHSLLNLEDILSTLQKEGKVSPHQAEQARIFTRNLESACSNLPVQNPFADKLTELMYRKRTNLILSLDATTKSDFFRILEATASEIAMVKVHVDILEDFDPTFPVRLSALAEEEDFYILADRKFADIGNTVRMQYRGGIYRIADWADAVTVHLISGEDILKGLFGDEGTQTQNGGSAFLLARMSSRNNLITEGYTRKVIEIGRKHPAWVAGYIGHGESLEDLKRFREKLPEGQLLLMPGVQLRKGGDELGQQYLCLEDAIEGGADGIIVGRGIYGATDPATAAKLYREKAWEAMDIHRPQRVAAATIA